MSTKYGRNFTNFQNVGLKGSINTIGQPSPGMLEMFPGATNAVSTLSISMISGSTAGSENGAVEHPYFHISNAGLSLGTGFIRLSALGAAPYGTIRASAAFQEDQAWRLPALSGIIGVFGTIAVGLETIAAAQHYSTNIVLSVAGAPVDRPDMTCIFGVSRLNGTATTRGFPIYIGNTPTNSGVELFFHNVGATASVAQTLEMNFICAR